MTINQLVEITGKTFRTVKKRLGGLSPARTEGNASYYKTKEALEAIYTADIKASDAEMAKESLLHERAKREKAELLVGELKGRLIPIEEVVKAVEKEYSIVRAQFRALPSALAKPLSIETAPNAVYERLKDEINQVLTELVADANYNERMVKHIATQDVVEAEVAAPEPSLEVEG